MVFLAMAVLGLLPGAVRSAVVAHDAGVAEIPGLDQVYERFAAAYAALDVDALASLYAPDVLYLSPSADVLRGRDAVHQYFDRFFGSVRKSNTTLVIGFHVLARGTAGDLAYDVGYYDLQFRGGEHPTTSRGKYAVVAQRDTAGAWRFKVDSYSAMPKPDALPPK